MKMASDKIDEVHAAHRVHGAATTPEVGYPLELKTSQKELDPRYFKEVGKGKYQTADEQDGSRES